MAAIIENDCIDCSIPNIKQNIYNNNNNYSDSFERENINKITEKSNYIVTPEKSKNLKKKLLNEMLRLTEKTQSDLDKIDCQKKGLLSRGIIKLRNESYNSDIFLKSIF
jgi:hypothetical protein